MPLQFPTLPSTPAARGDGLSDMMLKLAGEKRMREDQARRLMLDQTKMQHEAQRLDHQDRVQRVKDALGFQRESQDLLGKVLPMLKSQPDQARAMVEARAAAMSGLPEDMQEATRITLPPQGPRPVEPMEPTPLEAPAPGAPPVPYYTGAGRQAPSQDPGAQPFAVDIDGRPISAGGTASQSYRRRPDYQRYYEPNPNAPDPEGPLDLMPPPPHEGPLEAGEQAAQSSDLALQMEFDRAERTKYEKINDQEQAQYEQAEGAKQADYARRSEEQAETYQKQREAYDNPSYEIGLGGGRKVVYHEREIQQAETAKRLELASRWAETMMPRVSDETGQQFVRLIQGEIAFGADPNKASASFNVFLGQDAKGRVEMLKSAAQHANDLAKEGRAERNTKASEGRTKAALLQAGVKPLELDLKIANEARQALNQYHIQKGYKQDLRRTRELVGLGKNLLAKGPALDTTSAASFANLVQQRGILTDRDYDLFWNQIGSLGQQAKNWVTKKFTGEIDDTRRAQVLAAVRQLVGNVESDMDETAAGAWELLGTDEHVGQRAALMRSYYPHFAQPDDAAGGPAEPEAAAAPGKKLPGAGDLEGAAHGARKKKPKAAKAADWFNE